MSGVCPSGRIDVCVSVVTVRRVLAYALNQWPDPTDKEPPPPEGATAPPGFPTRTELAARYAERTGRDLSMLDYYVGFNRWKTAAIVHGVYARYCEGKKSSDDVDLDEIATP